MTGTTDSTGDAHLVTLYIKAYNQEDTVSAAIESAFSQTYEPLEILLSDDCSSDSTFAAMERMAERYRGPHRVALNRNATNLGIVKHTNRIAEMARGRLMVEGAGDDISEPRRVERLASAWLAGEGRIKAVHSAFTEIDEHGAPLGRGQSDPRIIDDPGPDPLTVLRTSANCIGATTAWDRGIFDHFGPIPDDCGVEDGVLFFRAVLLGEVAYLDEPLMRYRTGGFSRPDPRTPGHDYLYGDRIKFMRWRVTNARAFLRDLGKVDIAGKAELERVCREIIERDGFEVELAERGPLSKLTALPRAAARSVRSRDPHFAKQSLKHALGPAYVAYRDRRRADAGASSWLHRRLDARRLDRDLAGRGGLRWSRSRPCPRPVFDAGGAQIGPLLYVVCGYTSLDGSNDEIFVFDMRSERWVRRISTPPELAHSHCAVATDGERFIYFASGQRGPQCRPAVRDAFSYDTLEDRWHRLPPVPAPRYAGVMEHWHGRLHFIGGAAEDRWTPTADHWSLGVRDGVPDEGQWRAEQPIPVPGMHRASALVDGRLYVFGGQQGDFKAIPGDPDCRCTGLTPETYLSCAFRLDAPSASWERIADLPIAVSHCDFSTVVIDDRVLLLGGQVHKDPERSCLRLTDAIQAYDVRDDRWTIAGHLPYRLKIPVAGRLGRHLFVTTGQRGDGQGDTPGPITADTWKATLPEPPARVSPRRTPLSGKTVLMVSHDLSRTGAPLLLMETAQAMIGSGASVRLASAADDADGWNLASEFNIPRIPIETAAPLAREADLVVANTASDSTKAWVGACLDAAPEVAEKLVWWIHEIDVDLYRKDMAPLEKAALALFDSEAARAAWGETVRLPRNARVLHPALSDAFVEKTTQASLPFPTDRRRSRSGGLPSLDRAEIRKRLEVGPDDFLVCCIGTFLPQKGQRLLIRTVAGAARERGLPLKLLLVGLMDDRRRTALLRDLGPDERRVLSASRTYVSQSEYAAFYRASDAHVMNSQGGATDRGECFGRVTIEAMAFGLPVLGTAAGGTTEIIADGHTGLLFPVGEAGQTVLAGHLERLVRDPARARQLGEAGREHALGYFQQHRFLSELHEALASVGAAPRAW
jgi:glycosyltransferase involved in cell wall biosynthesis